MIRAGGRHPGALVLGGDKHALIIARSLGRRGIPVHVVAARGPQLSQACRYVRAIHRWPGPDEAARLELLTSLASRHGLGGWTLFVTEDSAATFASRHHRVLGERFRLTVAPHEITTRAADKRSAYALARAAGVDVPWTHAGVLDSRISPPLPCVVKPAVKETDNALTRDRAWRADTPAQLANLHHDAVALLPAAQVLVQELVPGGGEAQYSYAGVFREGEPLGTVVARRLRQYPVDFGHSSCFVVTAEEPEVEDMGRRVVRSLGYTGIAEIEFKRDPRDGRLKLLDVNPRVWTWCAAATRAGLDIPFVAWRLARGEPVAPSRAAPGVRWVRMAPDVLATARLVRRGELSIPQYLGGFHPPLAFATFARDDPLPAAAHLPLAVMRATLGRLQSVVPVSAPAPQASTPDLFSPSSSHVRNLRHHPAAR